MPIMTAAEARKRALEARKKLRQQADDFESKSKAKGKPLPKKKPKRG
jgi:hypothetical protein